MVRSLIAMFFSSTRKEEKKEGREEAMEGRKEGRKEGSDGRKEGRKEGSSMRFSSTFRVASAL
jgi:hypothetical protein